MLPRQDLTNVSLWHLLTSPGDACRSEFDPKLTSPKKVTQ